MLPMTSLFLRPQTEIVRTISKKNQAIEGIDKLDSQFTDFKLNFPAAFNEFQDKLNSNYDSYYKEKLKNYKFELVKNVDDRQV